MLWQLKFTVFTASALRKFCRLLLGYVIAFALAFVAIFTEMSRAPTEPLCQIAAESAFKLDKFYSVLLARLYSALDAHGRARSAHKLLWLIDLLLLLCANAIFLAAEVSGFALEALIVS